MICKFYIGYGGDDGLEDYYFEIFSSIKECAINAYHQQLSVDEDKFISLVNILKALKETGYFHNPNANNGYGWEYKLQEIDTNIYNDTCKKSEYCQDDIEIDIEDEDLEEFNNFEI